MATTFSYSPTPSIDHIPPSVGDAPVVLAPRSSPLALRFPIRGARRRRPRPNSPHGIPPLPRVDVPAICTTEMRRGDQQRQETHEHGKQHDQECTPGRLVFSPPTVRARRNDRRRHRTACFNVLPAHMTECRVVPQKSPTAATGLCFHASPGSPARTHDSTRDLPP